MSATTRLTDARRGPVPSRSRSSDRVGDALLKTLCTLAALLAVLVNAAIVYQVVHGARESISHFGFGFLTQSVWQPEFGKLGAATFLFGTAVRLTSCAQTRRWVRSCEVSRPPFVGLATAPSSALGSPSWARVSRRVVNGPVKIL